MSQQQPPSAPPPGWYPEQPGWERRWDGARWTEERRQIPQAPVQQHTVQRPVPAPGALPSPHDLPTVKPGEWPAQPAQPAEPVAPTPPTQVPPRQPVWPGAAPSEPPAFTPPTQAAGKFGPPPSGPPVGGPPPYGAPPQYGAPPVAPSPYAPPQKKKSLVWLWVTLLALVLVVALGSAAALVVLRPWEDDTTSASEDSRPTGDASEDAEDGEAPAPTSEPDTGESPAPPPDTVTGDIDGDGLGDAVAVFRDRSKDPTVRFTLTSTGTGFDTQREELDTFEDRVWLDVDQDGGNDGLTWVYETGDTLTITSDVNGEQQFTLRLIDDAPYVNLETGDFDGDGATDLLAYGETERHQVTAWVLRNNGDGFDEPEEWMVQDGATYFDVSFYPGDFTGDGLTDVAARVPTDSFRQKDDYYSGEYGVALLESTGSTFDVGPADQLGDDAYLTTAAVGDFAGDGTPRLAVFDTSGGAVEVQVYEWGGSSFGPASGWQGRLSSGDQGYVTAQLVSDVDGNGFDDLVYTYKSTKNDQLDGIRVALSDGSAFGAGELWADLPRCKDEYCFTYFQGG